jgi:glycosyltransferase involved in cell wall biosynthesis
VLAQTFQNWEYIIVNNCSTDGTLDIANGYAKRYRRITIHCNNTFVNCEENHNIAFGLISTKSKYCKVVSADDWIYPECIRLLVEVAEENPSVGIVGPYQLCGSEVKWKGGPSDVECISGRAVCRLKLLEGLAIFGPPTSNLCRSSLIRNNEPFFQSKLPYADTCACYEHLQHSDFGFLHEILSIERIHNERVSTAADALYADAVASLEYVLKYGPIYLSEDELDPILKWSFAMYYRRLGGSVLKSKDKEFWRFHITRMRELGSPISWKKVAWATLNEIVDEMKSPKTGYKKLVQVLKERWYEFAKVHR